MASPHGPRSGGQPCSRVMWSIFMATIFSPLDSSRDMTSPTRPRCTPSGFTSTNVRSIFCLYPNFIMGIQTSSPLRGRIEVVGIHLSKWSMGEGITPILNLPPSRGKEQPPHPAPWIPAFAGMTVGGGCRALKSAASRYWLTFSGALGGLCLACGCRWAG